MPISDIPIFSMLRTRMQWHQERQRLLAENVSNADTPNFRPRDLAPLQFDQLQAAGWRRSALARTATRPHRRALGRRLEPVPGSTAAAASRCGRPATR